MAVTQKDIALQLGITQSSVARALNGHPLISDETRRKVAAAARDLGYDRHSNRAARELVARRHGQRVKAGNIGVIVGGMSGAQRDPFHAPLLEGIETETVERGFDLVIFPCGADNKKPISSLLLDGSVDGIICISVLHGAAQARAANLPLVELNWDENSAVVPDAQDGMRQATSHLIVMGHRKIAYLGRHCVYPTGFPIWTAATRLMGYQAALRDAGLERPRASLIDATLACPDIAAGAAGMQRLLERHDYAGGPPPFSGLVCYNDLIAMGAINHLRKIGLRVPHDISVVGFDDISMGYGFMPALTSVQVDGVRMGQRAVQLLYERLDNSDGAAEPHEHLPVQLVIRESTARYAGVVPG